ncbi:MAG TPA: MaoC family dehydratase N-terminal domain-containing protein [Candidatus Bathyarchaeia archaeon]|nr:MaoC family dehydratase N-terminal domain-containing protein [Candidatus Bathyarchaeia archaeon]
MALAPLTLSRDIVGASAGPLAHDVDARWLMAYAAGLGETDARYFDTLAPSGPAAHPLFPVCYEWPVLLALRALTTSDEMATRSVHATHDLVLHRPIRAGETLFTTGRVTGLAHRRAGTLLTARNETVDAQGRHVATTDYGSVYRGVSFEGEDTGERAATGAFDMPSDAAQLEVAVPAGLAHIYSECARIWNPIHTDVAVARAAGLPGIILHGTATLALAVSCVLRHVGVDPRAVCRVSGRFTGMVPLPSQLTIRLASSPSGDVHRFTVTRDGSVVMSGGAVHLRWPAATR